MPERNQILPEAYRTRYDRFLNEQGQIEEREENIVDRAKEISLLAQRHLSELKESIKSFDFPSIEEEVYFFKEVKPLFTTSFLCYQKIYQIELLRPVGTIEIQQRYLEEEEHKINHFFTTYVSFYQYQRSRDTSNDIRYYTRGHLTDAALYYPIAAESDPSFSTGYDHLRAITIANDLINGYLQTAVRRLTHPELSVDDAAEESKLQWTASVIDFAEMIYGILANGAVNNGKVPARTLTRAIGKIFNIKVEFIAKKLEEIRSRKKNRHPYHDRTVRSLERKMDEDDEYAL